MELLSKISEDGTDLSMETWLESSFILPFKVVCIYAVLIKREKDKRNRGNNPFKMILEYIIA